MSNYFPENHQHIKLVLGDELIPGLRNSQFGAIHAIGAHFTLQNVPALITMPTGSGKTAVLILTPFVLKANRVLVLTPSRLVRAQITEQFESLNLLKKLGIVPLNTHPPKIAQVVRRLSKVEDWQELAKFDVVVGIPNSVSPSVEGVIAPPANLFDLILIDEAHHSPAESWKTILDVFGQARKVLFTATPFRRDRKTLDAVFCYTYPLSKAKEDSVFSEIEYIAVSPDTENILENDINVAKKTEELFIFDKSNNLSHYVMVRTDQLKRAEELFKIYSENTSLKLKTIHSRHSLSHVKETIQKLQQGKLDGIICVDMLGEGFDLPNLKIAAIHAPHKSLEVTLQFIGRFARTSKDTNIGNAKFVAVPSSIQIEAERLFEQDADWNQIVKNLSESKIEKEASNYKALATFSNPDISEDDLRNIPIHSLLPYLHAKIFQMDGDVNIKLPIELPTGVKIAHRRYSADLNCLLFITREYTRPRWTKFDKMTSVEYHLYTVFFHTETRLLFINTSNPSASIYRHIVEKLSRSTYQELSLDKVYKVMCGLKDCHFFNIGLANRTAAHGSESYRIMAGSDAQDGIDALDGQVYSQGHAFAKALDDGVPITIGYSSSSKVWSNRNVCIPEFVDWCKNIASKIISSRVVSTNTNIDIVATGMAVTELPQNPISAIWDGEVYQKNTIVVYKNSIEAEIECQLCDFDIKIDRGNCNENQIEFVICKQDVNYRFSYSLENGGTFKPIGTQSILVKAFPNNLPLSEFLNAYPLLFYFPDYSSLYKTTFVNSGLGEAEPFDRTQMRVVEWENEGVDICNECRTNSAGKISIHQYYQRELIDDSISITFYDHRSGEIADFITFKESESDVTVSFYHIKGSGGPKPGNRVDDLYEVCGQIVKCLYYTRSTQQLKEKIAERASGNSRYIKGNSNELERLMNVAKYKHYRYEMVLVQPGITKINCEERLLRLLGGCNSYIRRAQTMRLLVICSN